MDVMTCEVDSVVSRAGRCDYVMKPPGPAVPFLVLLYGCFGFTAHVVACFELARTASRWRNFLVYTRIVLFLLLGLGRRPAQLAQNLDKVSVESSPESSPKASDAAKYLPPRPSRSSARYSEVGFLNLWSTRAGLFRGLDRTSCPRRWCPCAYREQRRPVDFGDGLLDFYRERGCLTWLKTGMVLQTDKTRRGTFSFEAAESQGIFFQYDGEGRFAFNPSGKAWSMDVRHVLTMPVAVHPSVRLPRPDAAPDRGVGFCFAGPPEEAALARARMDRWVRGHLLPELNATEDDIRAAGLLLAQEPVRKPAATCSVWCFDSWATESSRSARSWAFDSVSASQITNHLPSASREGSDAPNGPSACDPGAGAAARGQRDRATLSPRRSSSPAVIARSVLGRSCLAPCVEPP